MTNFIIAVFAKLSSKLIFINVSHKFPVIFAVLLAAPPFDVVGVLTKKQLSPFVRTLVPWPTLRDCLPQMGF